MDKTDYAKMFDLKPQEWPLRILICASKERQVKLPHVAFVDPKTLLHLSFADQSFDLVLCPNILFIVDDLGAEGFHQKALKELIRVGSEVRVLPMVGETGEPVRYLGRVIQSLQEQKLGVELRQMSIGERNKNAMLRFWNTTCVVK